VEIEHKGSQTFPDGKGSGFIERDDLMSSVAFWYQTEPHKSWEPLPAGPDRLPFREETLVIGYKSVSRARHSSHPIQVQEVGDVTDGKELWFTPGDALAWVEIPFTVAKDQTSELWVALLHSWDYGSYRALLDGNEVAQVNLFSPDIQAKTHKLGTQTLSAGEHTLRFVCTGKADKSKGYDLGFDKLFARVPVYSRPPGFDLRKIQVRR
jgi:hypothetical protein